jgi:hypothetical protein
MIQGASALHLYQAVGTHMFNSSYLYSYQKVDGGARNKVWVSSNVGASWITLAVDTALGMSQMSGLFVIPADRNIFFIVGADSTVGGGLPIVGMTKDFGATWTRIDNPGGGTLQAVMGLVSGDMLYSSIFVDYFLV